VAILSRGYKGQCEHSEQPLVVDVEKHQPALCGDEPWLLASRLGKLSACVIANKRRYKSALAAKNWGADIVVLDDGMQHRKLHRDLEIVVIDGKTGFDTFLPAGKLREDPARLKHADLVLYVRDPEERVQRAVSSFTKAPQVTAQIVVEGVFDLEGRPQADLRGKKVALFCGIGNPERFVKTVEEMGAIVVFSHFSPDHEIPKEAELKEIALQAEKKGASVLLCTEKDKVKLCTANLSTSLPIAWVKTRLEIVHNQAAWGELVDKIKLLAGIVP
jgi:tetraacyldisaccharide 4'-kinase